MKNVAPFVDASLALQGYELSEEARQAVIQNFQFIELIARSLMETELDPELEMAPVFRPQGSR